MATGIEISNTMLYDLTFPIRSPVQSTIVLKYQWFSDVWYDCPRKRYS